VIDTPTKNSSLTRKVDTKTSSSGGSGISLTNGQLTVSRAFESHEESDVDIDHHGWVDIVDDPIIKVSNKWSETIKETSQSDNTGHFSLSIASDGAITSSHTSSSVSTGHLDSHEECRDRFRGYNDAGVLIDDVEAVRTVDTATNWHISADQDNGPFGQITTTVTDSEAEPVTTTQTQIIGSPPPPPGNPTSSGSTSGPTPVATTGPANGPIGPVATPTSDAASTAAWTPSPAGSQTASQASGSSGPVSATGGNTGPGGVPVNATIQTQPNGDQHVYDKDGNIIGMLGEAPKGVRFLY
jgi:hypothetical protein